MTAKRKTTPVLRRPLKPYPGEHPPRRKHHHHPDHDQLVTIVLALETQIMSLSTAVSNALAAQDQKIADLDAKVDAFIASHPPVDPADDAAVVSRVEAQGTAIDAISAKLG